MESFIYAFSDVDAPTWVIFPNEAGYKYSIIIEFSQPIDKSTLVSGHTFQLTLNEIAAQGSFQFSPDNRTAVFYTDKTIDEVLGHSLGAGDDLDISVKIRGQPGTVVDVEGNIWPFAGVYRERERGGIYAIPLNNPEDLLDGDDNGIPGGNFTVEWIVIG